MIQQNVVISSALQKIARGNIYLFFLPITSAMLLAAAFPPSLNRWLIFICLIPLFYFLDHSEPKKAFWFSWLAGFIFIGWSIKWFFSVLPAQWAGIENETVGFLLVGTIWLISTLSLSVFIGLFGYFWKHVKTQRIFIVPSLWIIAEYFRAIFFSLVWVGDYSLIGPYWTFANLGYAFAEFPILLQSTKIFGLYGAGFTIVAINLFLYEAASRAATRKVTAVIISSLLVILVYGWLITHMVQPATQEPIRVSLIQTDLATHALQTGEKFLEHTNKEIELVNLASAQLPRLIILPEGSRLSLRFGKITPQILEDAVGPTINVKIIDSARVYSDKPSPERIYYYETGKGLVAVKDKKFILPGGEYLPYIVRWPAQIFGAGPWLVNYDRLRSLAPPETKNFLLPVQNQKEGVNLCSAVLAPALWKDLTQSGAEILVNSASQSLFRGSGQFYSQTEAFIRFFAAANDRWLVQAANGGFNYIIDNQGSVMKKSPSIDNSLLNGEVFYRQNKVPYVKLGDWPVFLSILVLLLYFLHHRTRLSGRISAP